MYEVAISATRMMYSYKKGMDTPIETKILWL